MNYFELINNILIELNYSPVAAFSDLTKLEHKKLMNIINRLNKEICNMSDKFYFRQMQKKMNTYSDKIEYNVNISGKISTILSQNTQYKFEKDYTKFYTNNPPKNSYGIYGEKYLFSPSNEELRIFYITDNFVRDKKGELKSDFLLETDETIIPANYAEKLFVNGVAYNFKQNTSHPKYIHWKQEYDKALKDLLSKAKKISGDSVQIDGGYRKL